jgi:hypothetical protein
MPVMPATTPPLNTDLQPAAVTRRELGWRPAGVDCKTRQSEKAKPMTTEPCGHAASH